MSAAIGAIFAFVGRDFRVARSYKMAFAMNIVGTLMTLVTFRFISDLIATSDRIQLSGGSYFNFVVVGLALTQVLQGALGGPTTAVRNEQVQGTLEVLATQPLRTGSLAAGWATYPVTEALVQGSSMLLLAGLLGFRTGSPDWAAAMVGLLLAAVVFASLGILGAAFVLVFQQATAVTSWVTGGLSLISGVFFPLDTLPHWVERVSAFSPLTHILAVVRGALLDGKGITDLQGNIAALLVFAAVLPALSVYALGLALKRARRRGTISTY